MQVKSRWFGDSGKAAIAVAIACAALSLSPELRAGGQGNTRCGSAATTHRVGIGMASKTVSVTSEPVQACAGDSVLWDNTANKASGAQLIFAKDPFQGNGKHMIPGGKKAVIKIPASTQPGTYQYSVCAQNCGNANAARLDPHIIILTRKK
jgi:hypothetical protein